MNQMTQDVLYRDTISDTSMAVGDALPFPFNQRSFCRYEPIEKRIDEARVLVVDNLLRDEDDLSDVARSDSGRGGGGPTETRAADRPDGSGKHPQQCFSTGEAPLHRSGPYFRVGSGCG